MHRASKTKLKASHPIIAKLRQAARIASEHAYCPYSHFPVGAAILTENDHIFSGCNVENASFGLTICAERNAVFQAIARGYRNIKAVVVVAPTDSPAPPCGACRQVLNEFGPDADVFVFSNNESAIVSGIRGLLPDAFGPKNLTTPTDRLKPARPQQINRKEKTTRLRPSTLARS